MNNAEILLDIQQKLKAPKNQNNSYGGYKYRTAEGIIESVKPLLSEHKLVLSFVPEIYDILERVYVKVNVFLINTIGETVAQTCAFAREAEQQSGMNAGQLTGSTESYAKKYALCNLFAIDGEADLDQIDKEPKGNQQKPQATTPQPQPQNNDVFSAAITEMGAAKSMIDLKNCWEKYKQLQNNPLFQAKKEDMKQKLSNTK